MVISFTIHAQRMEIPSNKIGVCSSNFVVANKTMPRFYLFAVSPRATATQSSPQNAPAPMLGHFSYDHTLILSLSGLMMVR